MELSVAKEAFDGVMVSDGSLNRKSENSKALFSMTQSGREHLDWLNYVKKVLLTLRVMVSPIYPNFKVRSIQRSYDKKFYDHCSLCSYTSPIMGLQYRRWYPEKKKIVPNDLEITPRVLAHWFMGDGCSSWTRNDRVICFICTHSFTLPDIEGLVYKMKELGLERPHLYKQGSGRMIGIGNIADVQRLMDLIEPYVLPSYKYKIKRPGMRSSYVGPMKSKIKDAEPEKSLAAAKRRKNEVCEMW